MRKLKLLIAPLFTSSIVNAQTRQLTGSVKYMRISKGLRFATSKVKGKNIQATLSRWNIYVKYTSRESVTGIFFGRLSF